MAEDLPFNRGFEEVVANFRRHPHYLAALIPRYLPMKKPVNRDREPGFNDVPKRPESG